MLNRLRGYEGIRRNYKFWFYSYPSGYPYPYSAAILRHELDAIEKRFPLPNPMVAIGHSMGGCIARLLITDTGAARGFETALSLYAFQSTAKDCGQRRWSKSPLIIQ